MSIKFRKSFVLLLTILISLASLPMNAMAMAKPAKPLLTLSTSHTVVNSNSAIDIYSEVNYDDAFILVGAIQNEETGENIYETTILEMEINKSGINYLRPFAFTDSHPAGTYIVLVALIDSNYVSVAIESQEIEHIK